ncbi:MAG: hypothetical protein EOO01_19680 [Chitinophagaceae bacterium]|nr:MAG: hypothetical protein EOO01_19680 [Chitinophagaceae bacterium]
MVRENWEQKRAIFNKLDFKEENSAEILSGFSVRLASTFLPGGEKLSVLYAPEVRMQNVNYGFAFPQLEGLPVKFEIISSEGISFTYQLNKILTEPVSPAMFIIPQNGFRIMSYEENLELNLGYRK